MDVFANIAERGIAGRRELLCDPEPMKFDKRTVSLTATDLTPFPVKAKMSTKEELYRELDKAREYYAPFLENHAPEVKSYNKRQYIRDFLLNGEKRITVPEYEGPLGYAEKVYESEFTFDEIKPDKSYFICFLGADYKAFVYVNGVCVGSHEGFFSPFEFEITRVVKAGKNSLKIELYNDYVFMGNNYVGKPRIEGEKLYAATGLGWDDAAEGWHHCPAGMGIYNHVFAEERDTVHINDIFVRPLPREEKAEVWVEVNNMSYTPTPITLRVSLYGQNFKEVLLEGALYDPKVIKETKEEGDFTLGMPAKHGANLYKVHLNIENPRLWEPETPYLYQVQIEVCAGGRITDAGSCHFGMREFTQDNESTPKGRFYLNGKSIKLRGANTMGFEQQDVMRGDIKQLIDDMLLAKLCRMNYLRLTQRPVQDEVYDICDKLGLMTQTDLPLFACMRRSSLCEGIRQAEEMERLVRRHPCNIMVTYINEPAVNAHSAPHRHLRRDDLEKFFDACDIVVRMANPDRVIKHVDGDYDPPSSTLPDNHCYNLWYNGHGLDIGRLHKGYWFGTKPGWCFGCGEHGIEGLDFRSVMEKYYPKEWLAEPFSPKNIVNAQSEEFHRFFYDTQDSLDSWIEASQRFQAEGTTLMVEAFRRNPLMVSNAIHLFIDAWPAGWMKTIMDCERTPKPAYFAYRNALAPVIVTLRSDRFTYYEGETVSFETYVSNDTAYENESLTVRYELYRGGELVMSAETPARTAPGGVDYIASCEFKLDGVCDREEFTLRAILTDENGCEIDYNEKSFEVFEDVELGECDNVVLIEKLEPGEYEIAGETVKVINCIFNQRHFLSRKTGHPIVKDFKPNDFRYWYSKDADMITPILSASLEAKGFEPILMTVNKETEGQWDEGWPAVLACGIKKHEGRYYVICQADLRMENPIAKRFKKAIYDYCRG